MYVTVPGSPITETVYANGTGLPVVVEASSVEPDGSIIYKTVPATQIFSVVQVSGTAKAYTGIGSRGWNGTTSTPTGTASAKPIIASASGYHAYRLEARDNADTVIVTMDGKVVSWANDYDSSATATSATVAASCVSGLLIFGELMLIMASIFPIRRISLGFQPAT